MTTSEDAPGPGTDDHRAAPPSAKDDDTVSDDDSITTGVLAAERRAQDQLARRRRLLIGGAVLGLVIAGAVLAVITILQQRANTDAELASDRADARAAFARDVVDRSEDYRPPATTVAGDAATLLDTLEQFLTETVVTDAELARRAETLRLRLDREAVTLGGLIARDVPEPPELVDPERAVVVLRELEALRAEAAALHEEVPQALDDAERWLGAVRDVNRAVADHVAQVESEPTTSDPDELVELWRAERAALRRLSVAATAARDVSGLEEWAGAHQQYAEDLLAWIDEAVELLQERELDTYNARFDELFDTEDPFGLDTAVTDATDGALDSLALLQLGTLQERASLVVEAVDRTETTVGEQLGDDPAGAS